MRFRRLHAWHIGNTFRDDECPQQRSVDLDGRMAQVTQEC